MPYIPTTWVDEAPASSPVKYKVTDDSSGIVAASAKIEVVTGITTPGTPVSATNLNKLEAGVQTAQALAEAAAPKSLVTTAGDILYATASAALARLASGGAGNKYKHLRVNAAGTAPEWAGAVAAIAQRVASQVLGSGAIASVSHDTETQDTDNFFTLASPTILTVPFTGFYMVTGFITYEANNTGIRATRILQNGGVMCEHKMTSISGDVTSMTLSGIVKLTAGGTLLMDAYQNAGGNLNITATLSAVFVGP